jgi:hypothetical protein
MDVCRDECCVLSGRGLCDELITRPEESHRLSCVVVCDLETSWMRGPWPTGGLSRLKQTYYWYNEQCAVYSFCVSSCCCVYLCIRCTFDDVLFTYMCATDGEQLSKYVAQRARARSCVCVI